MSELSLSANLSLAWLRRAESAAAWVGGAAKAPALFKPEFVAQRQIDFAAAMEQVHCWQRQAVAS